MKPLNILIVDDDKTIRMQLEKELRRNFFETIQASTGEMALEILDQEKIDILFLDIKLPDMDGLEVLSWVKKEKPDCEAIVITGFGAEEIAVQSLKRGAIDYIEKPLKFDEINTALGRAQEKIANRAELSFKNTLLVIDDYVEQVELLRAVLEKKGFTVLSAQSGKEGLDIIEKNKVDVIITDICMNDMDGIEVIRNAKTMYQDIEGIVITGTKDQQLAIKALRAGAFDYITKPIELDELFFSVAKALERQNLKRNRLFRNRELVITTEIVTEMNEELERRIQERTNRLDQVQTQLFQTSKLATLGEMAAGLAHEINQPLGAIALVAAECRKLKERGKLTSEEIDSGLGDIEASVNRMTRIIQHIRTFARQDTMKFTSVNLNETIESALNLLREQLRLREIEVITDLNPDLPQITGEPYQLEQVWINLIVNARDALDEKQARVSKGGLEVKDCTKGIIHISSTHHPESKFVEICIADNALGMSKEVASKVFQPFFTTKEVGKSTGLGLPICYGIIERHQGKIEVDSEENEGTKIKVILPLEATCV